MIIGGGTGYELVNGVTKLPSPMVFTQTGERARGERGQAEVRSIGLVFCLVLVGGGRAGLQGPLAMADSQILRSREGWRQPPGCVSSVVGDCAECLHSPSAES